MLLALMIALSVQPARAAQAVVSVAPDPEYTRAHTITLDFDQPGTSVGSPSVTVATRTWDGGYQTMDSDECPAIKSVADAYAALPQPNASGPPIEPTLKDGFSTVVTRRTQSLDYAWTEETLRRSEFRIWGDYVVRTLMPCWGPLTPR